jgi:hypothetical protein
MKRAAVLIGVEKTGGLPRLKAARKGAEDMAAWTQAQGFATHLITDAAGPVDVATIRAKIRELVDPGNLDQLLVYFAGHGVNIRFGEFWLLSDAPVDADQAVNVAGAEALARRCGIPHVIMLSDACRTAAEGVQAQSIDGSAIFPNVDPSGLEKSVDLFFAATLGAPSHEVRDPQDSSKRYSAVYTDELLFALAGKYPESLVTDPADGMLVLRPRPLKKQLERKVPARIAQLLGNAVPVTQTPDARITSDDDAWLARFPAAPPDIANESMGFPAAPVSTPIAPPSLATATRVALRAAVSSATPVGDALDVLRVGGGRVVADEVIRDAQAFGPPHFETQCGFKVRGALVRAAFIDKGSVDLFDDSLLRVNLPGQPASNVLIELTDGRGVLLPAIQDFVASLSFEDGELRNVAYEPSDNTSRWQMYAAQRDEMSALRSLIASSARVGGFRLDRDDAPQLTERIRFAKGIDPTMALYAAYSYHNLGRRDLIRDMTRYVRDDIGVTFFDLAMLAGDKISPDPASQRIFPFVPMLAQGWSLLDAFAIRLPDSLARLRHSVGTSLWTVFDETGVRTVRAALQR